MLSTVWAETVILNDGRTLKGEIVGKEGDSIYFLSGGDLYLLTSDLIKQIKNDGNLTITKITFKKKDFINDDVDVTQLTPLPEIKVINFSQPIGGVQIIQPYIQPPNQPKYKTKVNFYSLILGVTFAGLAWDYFATAGEINDAIADLEEIEDILQTDLSNEIKEQRKIRTRKFITGSLLTATSAVSIVMSFESIEIKASPTAVELGYKF